ncbi:MAG: enamine deaminase RidA [Hyphomicrobiales bacterium]|nr:MAG: enamine deaminase RidA [Hyphomicrobiales bacterium]
MPTPDANNFVRHTPSTIRAPFANYSHAVEVPQGARLLVCSGQLGVTLEDDIPEGAQAQTDLIFENIIEILKSADMDLQDIVRINAYVSGREHLPGYMKARDKYVSTPPPASTLMIVSGFASEKFVVEIEVLAAKIDAA